MDVNAFQPNGSTVSLTAGTSTGSVALTGGGSGSNVRVYNSGTVVAFVNFGTSTVTAAVASGMPIAPGAVEMFTLPQSVTHAAAITAAGTPVLYFTTGQGI